ncbi:unnamed protein product [Adineta steineri]|uniref:Disease resistance R13L4/SHOC-2-like LRR domain-containing protein n=1 Tax=Adineta steineri TaxID=433720 RepID=A0A818XL15_9BILA|nr:unnamed protein product [Adineta steineri]CAF3738612.1 unnamed protein product [Adineta steineri]
MATNNKRCSSGTAPTTRAQSLSSLKQTSALSRSKTCGFTGTTSLKSKLEPLPQNKTPDLKAETLPENAHKLHPAMVNELSFHARNLTTIPILSQFNKLQILDLSCNNLTHIDNLRTLPNLRELKLYGNKIEQIENLDCLTQLQTLQLQYNDIEKIGFGLVYLTRLQLLRIDSNNLTSIRSEEISKLSQLKILDVSDCSIENLDFINSLPSITELRANHSCIKTLPNQIRNLRFLTDLDLSNNQLTNITSIKTLSALHLLRLTNNRIQDIQIISHLTHLSELYLANNQITSLPNSFHKLIELQCLDISNNSIQSWKDIDVLGRMNSLFLLHINGNPLLSDEENYIDKLSKLCSSLEIIDNVSVQTGDINIAPTESYEQLMNIDKELKDVDQSLEKSITNIQDQFHTIINDLQKLSEWYNDELTTNHSPETNTSHRNSKHRLFQALTFSEENYQN